MSDFRQTRFSDVCGTIDELKRILHEEAGAVLPGETLTSYVQDCLFMLERMEARLREFEALRDGLTVLLERMQSITQSRQTEAMKAAGALLERFAEGRKVGEGEAAQLSAQAEIVRDAASFAEYRLRRFKEAALELGQLYQTIEGSRGWTQETCAAEDAGLPAHLSAWLPRSPHREKILEWLRADRAHIITGESAPLVAFEDGGVIPLKDVRWSEAVQNFVPASFAPNPNGPRYRPGA
jgi:hypothetical protein